MRYATVHLSNGDVFTTSINGTDEEIRDYYKLGSTLNLGVEDDLLVQIVSVEVAPEESE